MRSANYSQKGFTIVELMIATVIFSVLLLVLAGTIIQIGRIYVKGMTNARTQEVARDIIKDVSETLQYENGTYTEIIDGSGVHSLCVGNRQYSFKLGQQLQDNQHGLLARNVGSGCLGTPPQNLFGAATVDDTELLGQGMRLAVLKAEPVVGKPGLYNVAVRVVYGDKDLLCGGSFSCDSTTGEIADDDLDAADLRCLNRQSGTQFCAISELSTVVERRLAQ